MEGAIAHRTVETNGISMHVAESGSDKNDRPAILFIHGFPELWYSWRPTCAATAAPPRAPPEVSDYSAFHVVGLLDALGLGKVRTPPCPAPVLQRDS
jgi:pimeloyl-ACP methyl ester carboxylesterase